MGDYASLISSQQGIPLQTLLEINNNFGDQYFVKPGQVKIKNDLITLMIQISNYIIDNLY